MILTVQMMSGNVATDRTNGRSHNRYQGNTTGAQRSDAAMGQANASGAGFWDLALNHAATSMPARTASPAATCGDATRRSASKSGSLKPNPWMYAPSDPVEIRP